MDRSGRWGLAVGVAALALTAGALGAPARSDYAAVARNVLPPGQSGGVLLDRHSTDQIHLYDGLTPHFGRVGSADLLRFFKSDRFGLGGARPERTERPRAGVRVLRDRFGVPHVYGRTRADVMYGAGWVTAEDRGLLLTLLRYPGRIAAIDIPGLDPFAFVGASRRFVPSAQTEALLDDQSRLLVGTARGRRLLRDVDAFLAGLNAQFRRSESGGATWTRRDIEAIVALLVARFGAGGGDEVRSSLFLSALQQRLGSARGRAVWEDLRQQDDPEAPVAVQGRFPYGGTLASDESGAVLLDDGSFEPWLDSSRVTAHASMSNALLVSARRSASGRPIMVAGPQVGYFYPELLMELDLHGAGIDARGASVPGLSFVILIGRGKDFGWSLTSSGSDVVDQYAETLCGDDVHYVYQGVCRAMETFDAGVLVGQEGVPQPVVFRTTVHGPVLGYATVGGRRVAISSRRSTRGRELMSALPLQELMMNRATSARSFFRIMRGFEAALNVFYVDDRHVAQYTGGRLPVRPPGTVPGLPTVGTGAFDWAGFLPPARHPQGIDPQPGILVNWNNKPARGFAAADDQWSYGSVHRVDLLARALGAQRRHTAASVVAAMNKAATQDLRVVEVWPTIRAVLGAADPSPRAMQAAKLLEAWWVAGASRLDRDLDGKIDHPGAAIMDAAWPRLADAVMRPVLGPLVPRLAELEARDDPPAAGGSAYIEGWYGYVDKDLRALLGRPVAGPFRERYCGGGDLAVCRDSLWAALEAAATELTATQGPDPSAWRADATTERIRFAGFLPRSMRWANRPTYQQILSFAGHRHRR